MTYIHKFAELPNGIRLSFVEQGDPAGTPLILLHGVTDSWRSFELVLPHLPQSIHAFAVTQRGHGDSDRPDSGYRTRDFAADIAAFAEVMGIERAVIVGHSMGSVNALRFVIDYPERTRGLVLVDSFATFRGNEAVVDFWQSTIAPLTDPIDPQLARDFQQSTIVQPAPEWFFEAVVEESLKVPARVWRAAFEGMLEDDFVEEFGRIIAPTLIVWGAHDNFCPRRDQDALLAAIRGSRLVVYEEAGHAAHWDEPQRFAADLTGFVNDLNASPQTA